MNVLGSNQFEVFEKKNFSFIFHKIKNKKKDNPRNSMTNNVPF